MIGAIKIYDGSGKLKEEITSEKAREIYNEQNKENWCLSPSERTHWNRLRVDETEKRSRYDRKGLQPWIKRKHKVNKQYEITCSVCNKKTTKASMDAKYCGKQCYAIARRRASHKKHKQKKGASTSQL